jgi:hypothetical protein
MVAPRWFNPRVGPVLRGGIDMLSYHRQFLLLTLFKQRHNDVRGLKKVWLKYFADEIIEPIEFDERSQFNTEKPNMVVFQGDRDFFGSLYPWRKYLRDELRLITRNKWNRVVDSMGDVPIAINVRRAKDFRDAKPEDLLSPTGPVRTPLQWFVRSLEVIREHLGYPAKACIVSDGSEQDLRELLELENTFFVRPGCAISDMLTLANAKILIASGGSSFSAWASFLGGMPTISLPGQSLTWFSLHQEREAYIGDFDPVNPPEAFMQQAQHVLGELRCA